MHVLRRQFPLRPSAAKTIHCCQGDTLDEAVVDLPSSKQEHMHYVALSRLRNILGLHILNLNEKKIAVSKKVQEEMTRLRENALLNSHIPFLYKDTSRTFKNLFQNVRSLHLHFPDVTSDYNVKAAVKCNYNDIEININQPVPNLHIMGIYCSKSKVKTSRFKTFASELLK